MTKHCLEILAENSQKLIKEIKEKYPSPLAKQLVAGARENADYMCDDKRESGPWYIIYNDELKKRI